MMRFLEHFNQLSGHRIGKRGNGGGAAKGWRTKSATAAGKFFHQSQKKTMLIVQRNKHLTERHVGLEVGK